MKDKYGNCPRPAGNDGASVTDADFLSPAEFAQRAGISLATLWRRLAAGDIPSIQPGGPRCRVLIPRAALNPMNWATPYRACGEEPPVGHPEATLRVGGTEPQRIPGPVPRWRTKPR